MNFILFLNKISQALIDSNWPLPGFILPTLIKSMVSLYFLKVTFSSSLTEEYILVTSAFLAIGKISIIFFSYIHNFQQNGLH